MSDLRNRKALLAEGTRDLELRAEFLDASPERQVDLALDDLKWAIEEKGYQYQFAPVIGYKTCCLLGAVRLRRFGGMVGWGHFCDGLSIDEFRELDKTMWDISEWAWANIEHLGERV